MSFYMNDDGHLQVNKAPETDRTYTLDLSAWGTVTAATFTVQSGLTMTQQGFNSTTASVRLAGGQAGATYRVTCTFTTSTVPQDSRTFYVVVGEL
jgi:hypothetical protein